MKKYIIISVIVIAIAAAAVYLELANHMNPISLLPQVSQIDDSSEIPTLSAQGSAPDFAGIDHWLNADALTMSQLHSKVVLVDFWTYSCINCIRTLPYVTKWYDTYHDKGFVVVGVHTPEFDFEKMTSNLADAIQRFGIHYPVAQDNEYGTWQAYHNHYWPAEYLIDQNGQIVYTEFGEGHYGRTENAIRKLLSLGMATSTPQASAPDVKSPEMYFGLSRLEYLSPSQQPSPVATSYTLPANLPLNRFGVEGNWQFNQQDAELAGSSGKIQLTYASGKVHFVAESGTGKPVRVRVLVDGKFIQEVQITKSMLYTLVDSNSYAQHTLELDILDPGLHAYTFTFG